MCFQVVDCITLSPTSLFLLTLVGSPLTAEAHEFWEVIPFWKRIPTLRIVQLIHIWSNKEVFTPGQIIIIILAQESNVILNLVTQITHDGIDFSGGQQIVKHKRVRLLCDLQVVSKRQEGVRCGNYVTWGSDIWGQPM